MIPAGQCTRVPEQDWVPVPTDLALAPAVIDAAATWPLRVRVESKSVHLTCADDDQSILPLVRSSVAYRVRTRDVTGALIAHLLQCHGWTREAPHARP